MPINRVPSYPAYLMDLLEGNRAFYRIQAITLGGRSASSGGSGAPPGGFIGQLAQQYVAYDTSELSTSSTGSKPSILDNLNHIRNLIALGSGSTSPKYDLQPANVSYSSSPGTSGSVSRGDHVHFHGQREGGNLHSIATTGSSGFMSSADKSKIDTLPTASPYALAGPFIFQTISATSGSMESIDFQNLPMGYSYLNIKGRIKSDIIATSGSAMLTFNTSGSLYIYESLRAVGATVTAGEVINSDRVSFNITGGTGADGGHAFDLTIYDYTKNLRPTFIMHHFYSGNWQTGNHNIHITSGYLNTSGSVNRITIKMQDGNGYIARYSIATCYLYKG